MEFLAKKGKGASPLLGVPLRFLFLLVCVFFCVFPPRLTSLRRACVCVCGRQKETRLLYFFEMSQPVGLSKYR